jgi:DNA-binding transcriptional LysR family regulator
MNIPMLEAFLAHADALNFTKSAEHLRISQSVFSRKINRLEEEFGCQLFTRDKRSVELTEYGRVFYDHARSIYANYTKWTLDLKQMKNNKLGLLRIGYLQDLPHHLFPRTIKKFRREFVQIELSYTDCSMTDIIDRLLSNEIDIGVSLSGNFAGHEKISHAALLSIPYCVAVSEEHPLSLNEYLSVSDLKDESFIMNSLDDYGPGSRYVFDICAVAGFEPNVAALTSLVPSMLILVKSGIGISIVANTARQIAPDGVKFIPLDREQAPPTTLGLLWKTSNSNPAIPAFIDTAQSLVGEVVAESESGADPNYLPADDGSAAS